MINFILYSLALASMWALFAVLIRWNFKANMKWWVIVVIPMCFIIISAFYRIGLIKWLEKHLLN